VIGLGFEASTINASENLSLKEQACMFEALDSILSTAKKKKKRKKEKEKESFGWARLPSKQIFQVQRYTF
jgi:hypothetical protein